METINERVTAYRKRIGLSKKDVALSLGLSPSTYSRMEAKGTIKPDIIVRLASILRVTANDILYGENKPELNEIESSVSDIPERRPTVNQPQLILNKDDYIQVTPQDRKRFVLASSMSAENKEFMLEVLQKLQNIKIISADKKDKILNILNDK
ncbi:MAG: helix-turn-helix domain-containing protein [Clostridia bacterium]|nr:helix-turn-helix domain-containing protein [Clostridia bacterium]